MAANNNLNIRRATKAQVAAKGVENPKVQENPWKPAIAVQNVKQVAAFVGDLEQNLINHIRAHGNNNLVVGCVAWFSNPRIVEAIAQHCSSVLLLVNDENYSTWGNGKNIELYKRLPQIQCSLKELFGHLNTPLNMWDTSNYAPVRCIRTTGDALMHSKYLIFFKTRGFEEFNSTTGQTEIVWKQVPASVWTGSMNYTIKASRNQENAVFIESEAIAQFYFNDFANSFGQSESLRTTGPSSTNNINNDSSSSLTTRESIPIGYPPATFGSSEFSKKKRQFSRPQTLTTKPSSSSFKTTTQKRRSGKSNFAKYTKAVLIRK